MVQNTFKQIVQDTDRVSVARKVKTMNTYFKTMLRTTFVTLLCFGAASASAQPLEIVVTPNLGGKAILVSANTIGGGTELVSEMNEKLTIAVNFSEALHNFTEDAGYVEGTSATPELEFQIGGKRKLAKFVSMFDSIMVFEYLPKPTDYGTGFTIKDSALVFEQRIILRNGVVIKNAGQTKTLQDARQYDQSIAQAVNSDSVNQAISLNMYKIETDPGLLNIDYGDIVPIDIRRPDAAFGNITKIDLIGSSTSSSVAAFQTTVVPIVAGSSYATFYVVGRAPGAATLRIYSQAQPAEFVEIPVVVNEPARIISLDTDIIEAFENAANPIQRVKVSLSRIAATDVVLDVERYSRPQDNGQRIICNNTLTIPAGRSSALFDIKTPDGDAYVELTFSDPNTDPTQKYASAVVEVYVKNVSPTIISPTATEDPDSGWIGKKETIVAGETKTLSVVVSDPAGTNDVMTYQWILNNVVQPDSGPTFSRAFDDEDVVKVVVNDGDGGIAELEFSITVEIGFLLKLKALPAGAGTFVFIDPASQVWDPVNGNRFSEKYQDKGVLVQVIPNPGYHILAWQADGGISDEARKVPATSDTVLISLEESLEVVHVFTKEFNFGEGFGDYDGDGLSDRWELYWNGEEDIEDIASTSAGNPRGEFGAHGNPDGDFLPLAGEIAIPNILDGGNIRVYEYPITEPVGNTGKWTGYLPHERNPFINIIEYRGLEEDRAGNGSWRRYADALPEVGSPTRGNAPASNPNLVDTDEDGMNDGWEYYFWTTIMYEVNPQNWRAFDPTFNYYDADDTSEAGLPLLRVGYSTQTITTNLPNVYAHDGRGSAFGGTVTNLPVQYGTFKITFDDGTEYVDAGKGYLAETIPVNHPYTGVPGSNVVDVLTIDYQTGEWTVVPPADAAAGTDYVITYEILDGLYSKQELLDRFDPAKKGVSAHDTDGDGLLDWEEFLLGTNPLHWDTDGDGMPDGWEVDRGLDPLIGDRVLGNANGALGNPDGDKMAKSGLIKHSSVYVNAKANQTFWNGERAFGYDPRIGWMEGSDPQPDFTNLEEFLVAEYYIHDLDLVDRVTPKNWLQYTTDPLDNDTNADGLPDGWALYVGLAPIVPRTPGNFDRQLGPIVGLGDDYDDDDLTVLAEFDCMQVAAFRTTDETVQVDGVTALRRAFGNPDSEWTNKPWPTDPWNPDTDGDGLPDGLEYRERKELGHLDMNADGSRLVNLNPTSVDTDGDWLPDGWEYYHGLQTTNSASPDFFVIDPETGEEIASPTGPYGDPDGDGLSNYQEYMTGVNYGWRYDKRYAPEDESYWLPERAVSGSEGTESETDPYDLQFRTYDPFDFLRPYPSPASLQRAFELLLVVEENFGITPNLPADPTYDYTDLEVLQRVMVVIQNPLFFDLTGPEQMVFLNFENDLRATKFSYGLQPLSWDPVFFAIPPRRRGMQYYFMKPQAPGIYATTHPRNIDSDNDGMDDYWEIFHGLNPLYGGDRGLDDLMVGDPRLNLAMSLNRGAFLPLARAGQEENRLFQEFSLWRPYNIGQPSGTNYYNLYWNTSIPYDLVNNPALSGCPWADIDKDGLSNREEAFNLYAADVQHHTDPSPYWITDVSYPDSHVRQYYSRGSFVWNWWWNWASTETVQMAPTYFFDFEINEGFDTDNDNISDREELTYGNNMGITDPLDFDNPRSRKAMYLDGYAACRTRNPYLHDKWALTSYAVELWFRAEEPVGNGMQTLIERPVAVPVDSPATAWAVRRNFRLSITNDGRLKAEVDNDALATVSVETTVANGQIVPNVWYHVAVTMDSQANRFKLYRNGALLASVPCDLKPVTGYFPGSQITDYDPPASTDVDVARKDVYTFSPAPIVVGASDSHPLGVVDGWNDPQLSRFFKGWVDEVRVWDRVRTQSQIQQDLYKRYTKEDVARVNDARFAWDQEHAFLATALTEFPQKLLYHYTFDNLPDVIPSSTRDPNAIIPGHDTDPVPFGYDSLRVKKARPPVYDYPGVPWWYYSGVRSTIYSTDYTYIPFIENTAAHLRQFPPLDIKTVRPVFDGNYNLLGYRWRKSEDWLGTSGGEMSTWDPIDPGSVFDVHPDMIPNAANPYGFRYLTGICSCYEVDPMTFSGEIGLFSQYENLPIHTDMLPLLNAVADIDVELWDGLGAGSNYAALDSDGDGLPDWWEIANGLDPYDPTGINGAYGDPDEDGLDNMGEYLAGTNPWESDTNGDGYSDYDSRDDNWSLTYGEMYDDGDGMPNDWEVQHGLDPNRYDADDDLDNDGWTNYEEYLAGTLPNSAYSYPVPSTEFTFHYDGEHEEIPSMIVQTYSERRYGATMGGRYDARLSTHRNVAGDSGYLGTDGTMLHQGQEIPVSYLAYGKIDPQGAVLTVLIPNEDGTGTFTEQVIPLTPFNEEMGQFRGSGMDQGAFLFYASGALYPWQGFAGLRYSMSYAHGWEFPVTVRNPIVSAGSYIRGGYNRFFGFLDLNGDGEYTAGEPCGLSVTRPVLVSYDSFSAVIACTDKLVGYPRISWEALPESQSTEPYRIAFQSGGNFVGTFYVEKPRTYFHEGDMLAQGMLGLDFGATTSGSFTYSVADGVDSVATGAIQFDLGTTATRRPMKARYPKQLEKIYGNIVKFEWEMDYRNAGATILIKGIDDGITYYSDTIPLPLRHGKVTDPVYYYTATPQTMDGKRYVELPPGRYTYTITEYIKSTGITKKSVTERFQIVKDEKEGREIYSISGNISYFGKAEVAEDVQVLHTFDGTQANYSGTVVGTTPISPGTISLQIVDLAGRVVESLSDSRADGALLSESGTALYGRIYYDLSEYTGSGPHTYTNPYFVSFADPITAGYKLRIAYKYFLKPIVVEAFKLNDNATSCHAVAGTPVARVKQYRMGAYTLRGLAPGKYAVRAYLDSNQNTMLDSWETSGIAVDGSSLGPIVYTAFPPIEVPQSQIGKDIVLRDKDTDNDLLPDAWEYQHYGSLSAKSGYDKDQLDLYIWQVYAKQVYGYGAKQGYAPKQKYADGSLDFDLYRTDTDGDGLSDAIEWNLTGTDIHLVDTDGDGVSDLEEFLSGSNPLDPNDTKPYKTLGVEFDADGNPYVVCPHPQLVRGIVISYILKYKAALTDKTWEPVCLFKVQAPDVTEGRLPAGEAIMKPEADDVDWHSGFFKIDVQVDFGKWEGFDDLEASTEDVE